jgi:hypothetical protein
VWYVSEVAKLRVVSASIDGPNVALVIRFEYMGEERFARWLGDTDWREPAALHRLFERVDAPRDDTGVGPAPPETVQLWCERVRSSAARRARGLRPSRVRGVGPCVV